MIIELPKQHTRIDKVAANDEYGPTLEFVYIDTEHQIMYAANGFILAAVPVKVEKDDDEYDGPIAVHREAMAWLMTKRRDGNIFVFDHGEVLSVQRGTRHVAVKKELTKGQLRFFERVGEIVAGTLRSKMIATAVFNVNLLRNIVQAGGSTTVFLGITEYSETARPPYLVKAGCAGAVMMPMYGDDGDLEKARDVLQIMVGEEEDEPEEDDTTEGPSETDEADPGATG